MTTHARLALIVTLSILIPGAGIALSQATGGSPGTPTSSGVGPAGEINPQPAGGEISTKACEALCDYAASAKNAAAAQALVAVLEAEVSQGSAKSGSCECGGSELTYRIQVSSGSKPISGNEDIVVSITTNKEGSGVPGKATATNTGSGDAIASAGSNTGTGKGGEAEATTKSGAAYASGGDSGGSHPGGNGKATTTTGTANAGGGAGGNAGGSRTAVGGQGGTATATYASTSNPINGISPITAGNHGSQTWAGAGPVLSSYYVNPGVPVPN